MFAVVVVVVVVIVVVVEVAHVIVPLSLQTLSTVGGWIISGNGRIWDDNDNIQLRIWLQSQHTTQLRDIKSWYNNVGTSRGSSFCFPARCLWHKTKLLFEINFVFAKLFQPCVLS